GYARAGGQANRAADGGGAGGLTPGGPLGRDDRRSSIPCDRNGPASRRHQAAITSDPAGAGYQRSHSAGRARSGQRPGGAVLAPDLSAPFADRVHRFERAAADHQPLQHFSEGGRADGLRSGFPRNLLSGRRLCRSRSGGRQPRRTADPAADQVRAGDQSEDGESARPHNPGDAAGTRRPGDRVKTLHTYFAANALDRNCRVPEEFHLRALPEPCVNRSWAGQTDVAIEHFETSLRLNPLRKAPATFGIAVGHFFARRLEKAAAMLLRSLQEYPNWAPCLRVLARGRRPRAVAQ